MRIWGYTIINPAYAASGVGILIATILALFYKSKFVQEETKVLLSQTKAEDAPLAAQQAQDEAGIKKVDDGIQQMMDERAKLRSQYITDQQKADAWNKPPQK